MKAKSTKNEIQMVDDLIKTVLSYKPDISGGEVWRVIKSVMTEEDQDVRDRLKRMEEKGDVVSVEKKGSALKFWSLKNRL